MGWTFTHRERGMSTEDFFRGEGLEHNGQQILKSAVVGNAFYAAIRNSDQATYRPGDVTCFVALISWTSGYHNFGYKDMDEFSGPNEAQCPARVLDLLSPIPECAHGDEKPWCGDCAAREWRAACRASSERQIAARKIKAGTTVRFAKAVTFTDGTVETTFQFIGRNTFRVPGIGRFSIPGWRESSFEVVPAS